MWGGYRYGFNGKEKNDEIEGAGNEYDYGMRESDPRIGGRFWSVDPLTKKYPWLTPYQFAGNNPIKFIDLDGLEPAKNPKDPANQDNRDPTGTIKKIYEESGGDKDFQKNYEQYMNGIYDPGATITGLENKDGGYTSDTKNAEKYNIWVNNKGVFKADDYPNWDARSFSNFLVGTLIKGTGPENIEFPTNGVVSNELKGAGVVNDALNNFYNFNKGVV